MEKFIQDTRITPKGVSKGTWGSEFATTSLRPTKAVGSGSDLQRAGITRETRGGTSIEKQSQRNNTSLPSDRE
ncbi:3500_t:CDS:1, partial [Acaulospora colombiana]